MTRTIPAAIGIGIVSLLAAACGGDAAEPTAAPSDEPTATAAPAPEPTAAEQATAAPEATAAPAPTTAPEPAPTESAPAEPTDDASPEAVDIIDFDFGPNDIVIEVGDTVEWTNVGDVNHTVTSNSAGFDSGSMSSGDTFTFVAEAPGQIPYFCSFHSSMQGTIEVVAAS